MYAVGVIQSLVLEFLLPFYEGLSSIRLISFIRRLRGSNSSLITSDTLLSSVRMLTTNMLDVVKKITMMQTRTHTHAHTHSHSLTLGD